MPMNKSLIFLCLCLFVLAWFAERTFNIQSTEKPANSQALAEYAAMSELVYYNVSKELIDQWEAARHEDDGGLVIPDFPLDGTLEGWFRSDTYGDRDSGLAYSWVYRFVDDPGYWDCLLYTSDAADE